ncbi:sugar phosphate isomerase/epimerase [Nonomuraea sp. KC401]|uniref:sugar phosphate isomerase/epimerase family protein n=1 Tax=unclassified Nonomuraea TaxID=2593643 RepID=UPI0010FDA444|nr:MULTISPECIES: sugar phosphate isomerase/epimerase family protein [unclassified Nonomuraea]NBE92564.1 TIM barrel protein [Nonomuraea sp. K271]TLF79761.1 sugar phosphate isomerase/epimerase [Nonomuraea sp. KC401]
MRLAVIGDEVSQDPALVADTTARLGFAGVEIRSMEGTPPHLLSDGQLRRMTGLLAERDLGVAGFAPPVFKSPLPRSDTELEKVTEVLAESCKRAGLAGAPHVRIFSFYRDGDPDPVRAARMAKRVIEQVRPPMPLLLETGTRTNSPTMRHSLQFLDELGRDDIGLLWDPGNSVFSGAEPEPFPQDYVLGNQLIRHVHVKDPDGTRQYVRLGDGDLPWPAILERLADDDYRGFVSLETHWRHGRVLTPRQRDEPWGESFSSGGLTASVECMRRLRSWVEPLRGTG